MVLRRAIHTCFSIAVISSVFLQLSCEPKGTKADGPVLLGSFYAIVDGDYFTGSENSGTLTDSALSITAQRAPDSNGTALIQFNIPKFAGTAIYPIDNLTSASYTEKGIKYFANSGRITISFASATHVSGTFSFVTERLGVTKNVSAGRFEMYK